MLLNIVLYLLIYSFIGWCCECIFCSIQQGKLVNRGFLTGPFCPIYGFGALIMIGAAAFLPDHVIIIFLGGMVLTSILEYVTSWGMEKIFHTAWWDYSGEKYNLNGRVCLLNSTLFGIMCIILHFDIHPLVRGLIEPLSKDFKIGFLVAVSMYFCADLAMSIYSALGINIRLDRLQTLRIELEEKYHELDQKLELSKFADELWALNPQDELVERFQHKISNIDFFQRRLLDAFPAIENKRHPKSLGALKENLRKRRENNESRK